MSKTVYFIRHAKSSWDQIGLKDHDRPLNKRGLRDGPLMAEKMLELGNNLDQIITSTAKRAKQTAKFFKSSYNISKDRFHEDSDLFHGDIDDYLEGARLLADDQFETAAVFAHNPGMTYLANNFSEDYIDNVPTCGISKIVFDVAQFSEISKDNGRLEAFYYPKMFL